MKLHCGDVCLSLQQVSHYFASHTHHIQVIQLVGDDGGRFSSKSKRVRDNLRATVNEIAVHLDMSCGLTHHNVQGIFSLIKFLQGGCHES